MSFVELAIVLSHHEHAAQFDYDVELSFNRSDDDVEPSPVKGKATIDISRLSQEFDDGVYGQILTEKRRNAVWFELAHDRLIEPVHESNAAWLKANLNQFQRQAALWARQHRPDTLLLHGAPLDEAESWLTTEGIENLTDVEREFLERCLEARTETEQETILLRQQAARDQKQIRRIFTLAVVLGIFLLAAVVAIKIAVDKAEELRNTVRVKQSQELVLRSAAALNDDPDLALLLSAKAFETEATVDARIALFEALENSSHTEHFCTEMMDQFGDLPLVMTVRYWLRQGPKRSNCGTPIITSSLPRLVGD